MSFCQLLWHNIGQKNAEEQMMSTVLEEVSGYDFVVDAEFVRRRVDDWQRRVEDLFAQIAEWLPAGYSLREGQHRIMAENMMRDYGVAERRLPMPELIRDGAVVGRLEPRGLWIVGTNGRVNLTVDGRHYRIIDEAESFETPVWKIATLAERKYRPLDQASLLAAFES